MSRAQAIAALKRPVVLIGGLAILAVVLVWLFAFYLPQGKRLTSLQAKEQSLRSAVAAGQAKVARLEKESQHSKQIRAMASQLAGYAPQSAELYTYVTTISAAAKAAGTTLGSIAFGSPAPVAGSKFSSIPVKVASKGTYDQMLAFIKDIYGLPRLTDIDSISISGGGAGTNRASPLTISFTLAIFTTQKPTAGAS